METLKGLGNLPVDQVLCTTKWAYLGNECIEIHIF